MPAPVFPGFARIPFCIAAPTGTFAGTDARVLVDSYIPGFTVALERLAYIVGPVAGAGAGGTQTFVLRRGGTTGTALATLIVALANATVGKYLSTAVAASEDDDGILKDADSFSLTRTVTGTAYTTEPLGTFLIIARQQPQKKR